MRIFAILVCIGLLAACAPSDPAGTKRLAALKTSPCRIQGIDVAVECAVLQVFEDRAAAKGRKIDIRVAILRAQNDRNKSDPVFVFAGGPGQSAIQIAAQVKGILGKLNRERDLVFVDQRGTGDSNGMFCDFGEDDSLQLMSESGQMTQAIRDCLAAALAHADPTLYTTSIAQQDLEDVREALGYAKINLWGGSYGTRAALEYLRRYPGNVRTATLDGMAPFGIRLPLSFIDDGEAALNALLADCEKSEPCRRTFPRLGADLRKLLADLRARPRSVDITHPRTGERQRLEATPQLVLGGVRAALYGANLASVLPAGIKSAAEGDFGPLVTLALVLGGSLQDQLAMGMHMSVICAEDWPLVQPESVKLDARKFFGAELIEAHGRMCGIWPRGSVPKDYYDPVSTDVPVLLLSGGIDPATPPHHAEAVLKGLSRGKHLVAPNLAHGVSAQGCAPELIRRFIEDGNADKVDGSCLAKIPRPTFFQPATATAS